jgi:metallo-beta-lactamase class B
MKKSTLPISLLSAALALAGCANAPTSTSQSAPSDRSIQAHVDKANAAAENDLTFLLPLCKAPTSTEPSPEEMNKVIAAQIARPAPPPAKVFDNLYFLGGAWSSAWAIDTPDGVILLDALNNRFEAAALIENGMRKVGLDPARIKTIVVSHGHGDHYGGVPYLVEKYKARVIMSDLDWTMTETKLEFASPLWGAAPKRDVSAKDGEQVRLGGTTVTLYLTPGHTVGTLSSVFDVAAGGQRHRVLLWGGTAFNFGNKPERLTSYIESTERMKTIARQQGIDILISNHPGWDNAVQKMDLLSKQRLPHPFVVGTPAVERAMTVMSECAQATRDRYAIR